MELPPFYDPAKVGTIYEPDLGSAYEAGLRVYQSPASQDKSRILLWLVDVQRSILCFLRRLVGCLYPMR
jgi:hypothetical protein